VSRDSSVGISNGLQAWRPGNQGSIPGRGKYIFFSVGSRPAVRLTQPPIHWVPGAVCPAVKRSHLLVLLWLRMVAL
jgi:hypothetical protein